MTTELGHHQMYLIEEFADDYLERRLDRRDLVKRVLLMTGSVPLTASVLFSLGCSGGGSETTPAATASTGGGAAAPTVAAAQPTPAGTPTGPGTSENDPSLTATMVEFPGQAGAVKAYLARPKDKTGLPAVVVIHENRGLVDHTKDVARRYAKEGFVALAVDLISRMGGTGPDTNANTGNLGALARNPADLVSDVQSGLNYLKAQPYVKPGALGLTGFCFGGGITWETTATSQDLKASAPYYGAPEPTPEKLDTLVKMPAAVLAIYGGTDTRITAAAPDVEAKYKAANKPIEVKIYPNVGHAFFNDTGQAYNKEAADDAWKVTLAHFRKYLA
jgi:carboxymethylenebutenolidase